MEISIKAFTVIGSDGEPVEAYTLTDGKGCDLDISYWLTEAEAEEHRLLLTDIENSRARQAST